MSALLVGVVWFLSSSIYATWANGAFLRQFRDPLLHIFIRFLGSAVVCAIVSLFSGGFRPREYFSSLKNMFVPAFLLWIANFTNSISLSISGITLTYVVKACIPVFTVLICTLRGQKFPVLIYVSLIPICVGVALASGSDLDFSLWGFLASLTSSLAQTLMNISSKEIRAKHKYTGAQCFFPMVSIATLLTIPVIAAQSYLHLNNQLYLGEGAAPPALETFLSSLGQGLLPLDSQKTIAFLTNTANSATSISFTSIDTFLSSLRAFTDSFTLHSSWPAQLLTHTALGYYIEYLLNFVFVGFVSSVTFSVCDVGRRLAVIGFGAMMFNKPLTQSNIVGIFIALSGVLWYSYLDSVYSSPPKTKKSN